MYKPYDRIFTTFGSYYKHLLLIVAAILLNVLWQSSFNLSLRLSLSFFSFLWLPFWATDIQQCTCFFACTYLIVRSKRPIASPIHGFSSRQKFQVNSLPENSQQIIIDINGIGVWFESISSPSGFNLFALFSFLVNTIQSAFEAYPKWMAFYSCVITAKLITIYRLLTLSCAYWFYTNGGFKLCWVVPCVSCKVFFFFTHSILWSESIASDNSSQMWLG